MWHPRASRSPRCGDALAALAAVAATCGWSQQPDYFPLHVGNQWVYRTGGTRGGDPLTLAITRTAEFGGQSYSLLDGWPRGPYWLRQDADGRVWNYDTTAQREQLWYAFQTPIGRVYEESLPWCCGRAEVVSRNAKYEGPIGEAGNALELRYPGVFQVGLDRELFLPYIGLLHRLENTGGPTVAFYDLVYARVGGVTVLAEKKVSFRLSLDRSVYVANLQPPVDPRRAVPRMTARLTLRNTQSEPLTLDFPSSQIYDLAIRNEKGEGVYQWSSNLGFVQVLQTTEIGPGEKNWVITVPLAREAGRPLPPGKYTAEAWLTTVGERQYSAKTAFQIQHVF